MKFSAKILSAALAIASATATAAASSTSSTESNTNSNSHSNHGLPSHHPPVRVLHPTLAKFSPQFRCPYAQEWLAKGAHKAAMDLGLTTTTTSTGKEPNPTTTHRSSSPDERRRRALQAQAAAATATTVMGSCAYDNVWSVSESDKRACMEFRGEGWTPNGMDERCKNEPNNLVSTNGQGCAFPETPQLAGWCVKESGFVSATATATESSASASAMVEASAMMVSGASDCNGNKMACETFVGGSWQAAAACGGGTSTSTASPDGTGTANHAGGFDYTMGPPSGAGGGDNTCLLAPGKSSQVKFVRSIDRSFLVFVPFITAFGSLGLHCNPMRCRMPLCQKRKAYVRSIASFKTEMFLICLRSLLRLDAFS